MVEYLNSGHEQPTFIWTHKIKALRWQNLAPDSTNFALKFKFMSEALQVPTKFYRQASIYRNIKNKSYIGLTELVDRVQRDMLHDEYNIGISTRSIQRDIKEMNDNWISIRYNRLHKGYYIPDDEKINPIIEEIWMRLSLLSALKVTENLSDFILPEQREIVGLHCLPLLITAMKKNLIVEFDYQKFTDTTATSRTVEPYFLKQFDGRWYLIAKEVGNDILKFVSGYM